MGNEKVSWINYSFSGIATSGALGHCWALLKLHFFPLWPPGWWPYDSANYVYI